MARWILAIADDLTGALEAGAKFAGRGLPARVSTATTVAAAPDVPVLVIDTETRHLAPSEAHAVVRDVAAGASRHAPWLVYKKTDSTLRGNIASELRALLGAFPERNLVYAPAYPAMGRMVRDGRLYVAGLPAHRSAFASDALNPVHHNDVRGMLEGIPGVVVDGESDADVQAVGRSVAAEGDTTLAAGPAALADAIAESAPLPRSSVRSLPRVPRCLVVNGSLHPISAAQVAFARTHGCLDHGWRSLDEDTGGSGLERALRVGESVRRSLEDSPADAVLVIGGDTAFGIHRAFESQPFDPYGDVVPGVPLSRCGDLFWITKAGGFGEPGVLCEIRRRLT